MRKFGLTFLFLIILFFSIVNPSSGFFSSLGITPLKLDVAARPLSMGEAFSAMPDIDSIYYNAACLAWSKGISVNLTDMSNFSAAQAYPTGNDMAFGLSFSMIKNTGITTTSGGTADAVGNVVVLSYATKLSAVPVFPSEDIYRNIGMGISLKLLLNEGISETNQLDKNGNGYDLDIGGYYKALPWLSIGAAAHNILPQNTFGGGVVKWKGVVGEEGIPAYFNIGAAAKILGDIRSPFYREDQELTVAFDVEKYVQGSPTYKFGLEYALLNSFFVRGGILNNGTTGRSDFNFGLGYKTEGWGANIAYAKDQASNSNKLFFNFLYYPSDWVFLSSPLESISPEGNVSTYRATYEVSGKVKPGVGVIIKKRPLKLTPENTFMHVASLELGQNAITIETNYDTEKLLKNINIYRKTAPKNPFSSINIYDNYLTEDNQIEIFGKVLNDATKLIINGKTIKIGEDKTFVSAQKLTLGQNFAKTVVYFEDQPVKTDFLIYRRTPVKVIPIKEIEIPEIKEVVEPKIKEIKKVVPKKKPVKKQKKVIKKFKKISFKKIQAFIKKKMNITIKKESKVKIPGYFGVYVLNDINYIALRQLSDGLISIDFYNSSIKQWKVIDRISYDELLMF